MKFLSNQKGKADSFSFGLFNRINLNKITYLLFINSFFPR